MWPDPRGVIRRLGVEPEMSVVDLCCGDGYFTAPLAQVVNGQVFAIDLDPAMLVQARTEVARQGVTGVEWICADARELAELLPRRVDYVLIANTFHGVPDQTDLARTVARVLNPGGRFTIVNWHQMPREQTTVLGKPRGPKAEMRMSPGDVQRILEPLGFRLERVVELPPFHYGAIFHTAQAAQDAGTGGMS